MKQKIFYLLITYVLLIVSCEEPSIVNTIVPAGKSHVDFNIETTDPVISTRSSSIDTAIHDLAILVFQNDKLVPNESHFFEVYHPDELANVELENGMKKIVAVANIGYNIIPYVDSYDEFRSYPLTRRDGIPGDEMAGDAQENGSTDIIVSGDRAVNIILKRLKAKVTVAIDRTELSRYVSVEPYKIALRNVTNTTTLLDNFTLTESENRVDEGHSFSTANGYQIDFPNHKSPNQPALFLYENMQPDGRFDEDLGCKVPANTPQGDQVALESNKTCSYLEVYADYIDNTPGNRRKGKIIYRFFLGKDMLKSLAVERNYHYQVTLQLIGTARTPSWKIESHLAGQVNIDDIYIGYQKGAQQEVRVECGEYIENTLTFPIYWQVTYEYPAGFLETQQSSGISFNTHFSIPVETYSANNNLYEGRDAYLDIKVWTELPFFYAVTERVKISQVPRINYPVGVVMSSEKNSTIPFEIKMHDKAYMDRHQERLISIHSYGEWSVEVEKGADWLELVDKHNDNRGSKIQGIDGAIKLGVRAKSRNPISSNRVGVILVKYHNFQCQHYIYVTQGFNPQSLYSGMRAWSMFNMKGRDGKHIHQTHYPTHSGWFFKGGSKIGIHPYAPGVNQDVYTIETSNGRFRRWRDIHSNGSYDEDEQGPCPKGYHVASEAALEVLADHKYGIESSSGYVIDDNDGEHSEDQSNSYLDITGTDGATMGTLFVQKNRGSYYGNSIFFTYGRYGHGTRQNYYGGVLFYDFNFIRGNYGARYWGEEDLYLDMDYRENTVELREGSSSFRDNGLFVKCIKN